MSMMTEQEKLASVRNAIAFYEDRDREWGRVLDEWESATDNRAGAIKEKLDEVRADAHEAACEVMSLLRHHAPEHATIADLFGDGEPVDMEAEVSALRESRNRLASGYLVMSNYAFGPKGRNLFPLVMHWHGEVRTEDLVDVKEEIWAQIDTYENEKSYGDEDDDDEDDN